jgi:hypothetical protein
MRQCESDRATPRSSPSIEVFSMFRRTSRHAGLLARDG